MTLEFEKLTSSVEDMVQQTSQRWSQQQDQLREARKRLRAHATSWKEIDEALDRAINKSDEKYYRSARPLHKNHRLDVGIPPAELLPQATIVACDGSQIVPDRHAPFLYYLINVGTITYYHGSGEPPDVLTSPILQYPRGADIDEDDAFTLNSALVNLWRDRHEIETLAEAVRQARDFLGPQLAIMDQRLLYWPAGGLPGRESHKVVEAWQDSMTDMRHAGALLAGYIDRPGKRSVLTMLHSLDINRPGFKVSELYNSPLFNRLTDIDLYELFLQPGDRSAVFAEISQHNSAFRRRDPENEVCFFYLRTGEGKGQLARVDIPMWVARDETTVSAVHALIYDQCQILGNYPYVITRADEIAVVGKRDQEELENRIALRLAEQGIDTTMTSKQQSKDYARASKTRHEGI
jgi:hypothetical protein